MKNVRRDEDRPSEQSRNEAIGFATAESEKTAAAGMAAGSEIAPAGGPVLPSEAENGAQTGMSMLPKRKRKRDRFQDASKRFVKLATEWSHRGEVAERNAAWEVHEQNRTDRNVYATEGHREKCELDDQNRTDRNGEMQELNHEAHESYGDASPRFCSVCGELTRVVYSRQMGGVVIRGRRCRRRHMFRTEERVVAPTPAKKRRDAAAGASFQPVRAQACARCGSRVEVRGD